MFGRYPARAFTVRILLTGAGGQIGREIFQHALFPCIGLTHQQLDITKITSVQHAMKNYAPTIVVNAAAYTKVDLAEKEVTQAYLINQLGAANLASCCEEYGVPLIHLSTDYIFNGKNKMPYTENDIPAPINIYGKSKLAGEEAIRATLMQHIILRTSWVFGRYGNNFVKTLLRITKEQNTCRVVQDQIGCPTSAIDIATVVWKIIHTLEKNSIPWGTYHYVGAPAVSWYEFAQTFLPPNVECLPVNTMDYPTLAARPSYSALNCDKINSVLGIEIPQWKNAVDQLLIYEKNSSNSTRPSR